MLVCNLVIGLNLYLTGNSFHCLHWTWLQLKKTSGGTEHPQGQTMSAARQRRRSTNQLSFFRGLLDPICYLKLFFFFNVFIVENKSWANRSSEADQLEMRKNGWTSQEFSAYVSVYSARNRSLTVTWDYSHKTSNSRSADKPAAISDASCRYYSSCCSACSPSSFLLTAHMPVIQEVLLLLLPGNQSAPDDPD